MKIPEIDPVKTRKKLKLNQSAFWGRVQVTQSGGSRFECGRKISGPVRKLLVLAYGTEAQAQKLFAELRGKEAG